MLNVDPPDHRRLRGLVARGVHAGTGRGPGAGDPAASPTSSSTTSPRTGRPGRPWSTWSPATPTPLPFQVIGELLGVPAEDRPGSTTGSRPCSAAGPATPPPDAVAASDGIVGYLGDLVEAKRVPARRRPGLGARRRRDDGDRLTEPGAALQPVPARRRRSRHHHQPDRQRRGRPARPPRPARPRCSTTRGRLPGAVEELLRFTAPVPHATFRMTTEAVDLDGTVGARAAQQVLVCLAAANRDPAAFDDPDRLDVTRPPRHRTSPSATASTTASARRWPGWRPRRLRARCSAGSPTSRSPSTGPRWRGPTATGCPPRPRRAPGPARSAARIRRRPRRRPDPRRPRHHLRRNR